jgi:hypothetical protein
VGRKASFIGPSRKASCGETRVSREKKVSGKIGLILPVPKGFFDRLGRNASRQLDKERQVARIRRSKELRADQRLPFKQSIS